MSRHHDPDDRYTVNDVLPALCGYREVCRLFGYSVAQFYRLEAEGAFDFARVHPAIGARRYSGDRLMAYARGELVGLTPVRKRA